MRKDRKYHGNGITRKKRNTQKCKERKKHGKDEQNSMNVLIE